MTTKITPPREIAINSVDCRNIIESFAKGFQYNGANIYPDKALKTDVKYLSEDYVNQMLEAKDLEIDKLNFMVERQLAIPMKFYANPVQLEQDKVATELINRVKSEFNLRLAKKDTQTIREIFLEYANTINIQLDENIKWLVRHLKFVYETQGQKWISTKDMLPEPDEDVLIINDVRKWDEKRPVRIMIAHTGFFENQFTIGGPNALTGYHKIKGLYFAVPAILHPESVTHWMPLPKQP